jgi:anti-sigma B factor antagonist
VHQTTGQATLRLVGEIDFETAPRFVDALADALERMDGVLCIDLAAVTFLDSWGLALLAGAWRDADGRGAVVVVRGANPAVRRLLEICAMATLFEWED